MTGEWRLEKKEVQENGETCGLLQTPLGADSGAQYTDLRFWDT